MRYPRVGMRTLNEYEYWAPTSSRGWPLRSATQMGAGRGPGAQVQVIFNQINALLARFTFGFNWFGLLCLCFCFGSPCPGVYVWTALRWSTTRMQACAPFVAHGHVLRVENTYFSAHFRKCTRQRVNGRYAPNSGLAHPDRRQVLALSITAFKSA